MNRCIQYTIVYIDTTEGPSYARTLRIPLLAFQEKINKALNTHFKSLH